MSRCRRLVPLLALVALAGAAVAIIPALASGQAPPSSASFAAIDSPGVYGSSHSWQTSGGGNSATIAQGGTVSFSYSTGPTPQGTSMHNVVFTGGPGTPTCTQTQGQNSGAVPPLPGMPTGPGWAGHCTFTTPGTYTFECGLHGASMSGTVVVQATSGGGGGGGGTTTTTSTTTAGSTSTTPAGGGTPPGQGGTPPGQGGTQQPSPGGGGGGSPAATAVLASALAVSAGQRGATVHGSVDVAQANSALLVRLTAARASLARSGSSATVVGRLSRVVRRAGRVGFAVRLNSAGRRALRRHGRLPLLVNVTVRAPNGQSQGLSRRVALGR